MTGRQLAGIVLTIGGLGGGLAEQCGAQGRTDIVAGSGAVAAMVRLGVAAKPGFEVRPFGVVYPPAAASSGHRAIAGAVVGGIVGLVAGAVLGNQIRTSCEANCAGVSIGSARSSVAASAP